MQSPSVIYLLGVSQFGLIYSANMCWAPTVGDTVLHPGDTVNRTASPHPCGAHRPHHLSQTLPGSPPVSALPVPWLQCPPLFLSSDNDHVSFKVPSPEVVPDLSPCVSVALPMLYFAWYGKCSRNVFILASFYNSAYSKRSVVNSSWTGITSHSSFHPRWLARCRAAV